MNIRMRCRTIVMLAILVATNVATADEEILVGAGWLDCEQILEFRAKSETKAEADIYAGIQLSWAQGFMSALNMKHYGTNNTVDLSDSTKQQDWLDRFCENNPKSKYFHASVLFWNELRKQQGLSPDSPLILK